MFLLVCWAVGIFLELIYDGVEKNQQYGLSSIPQRKQDQRCLLTLSMLHGEVSVGIESDSVPFFFFYARRQKATGCWSCAPGTEGQRRKRCCQGGWGHFRKMSSHSVMFSEVGSASGYSDEHPLGGGD